MDRGSWTEAVGDSWREEIKGRDTAQRGWGDREKRRKNAQRSQGIDLQNRFTQIRRKK